MSAEWKIKRKEFFARCAQAAIGLGMGLSCGRSEPAQSGDPAAAPAGKADSGDVSPVYRKLGAPGIEVTEVGFGASRTMDPQLINYAYEQGINFFDTGRSYYNGQNEVLVGKVFDGKRDKVVINSKVQPGTLEKMRSDLETSLQALRTDYIDCLLIHGASEPEHIYGDAAVELLETAREQGKIRTFGFSAHSNAFGLLELLAEKGFHEVVMVPYNFMGSYTHMLAGSQAQWDAERLEELIDACGSRGVSFIGMKTCSGGYMKDDSGQGSYRAALKWVLQNPHVKTNAVAMGNFQQIEEDMGAMGGGGEALNETENELLARYAALYGGEYCRMCGACRGQCPAGVDAAEVNRLQMYAESYGGDMRIEAVRSYASLGGRAASECESCDDCSVACPWGLQLAGKLRRAHAVLG